MRRVTMMFCAVLLFWVLWSASDSFGAEPPAPPRASLQSAITISVSPQNFPPPTALFQPPAGWSIQKITSLGIDSTMPALCAPAVEGVPAHLVVFTGTGPGGDWTYSTCATPYGWAGWWRMTSRGSTTAAPTVPLADK